MQLSKIYLVHLRKGYSVSKNEFCAGLVSKVLHWNKKSAYSVWNNSVRNAHLNSVYEPPFWFAISEGPLAKHWYGQLTRNTYSIQHH